MRTILKVLCWVPLLGIIPEGFLALAYHEPYLCDSSNLIRYWTSMMYHGVLTPAVVVNVLFP